MCPVFSKALDQVDIIRRLLLLVLLVSRLVSSPLSICNQILKYGYEACDCQIWDLFLPGTLVLML